jgi:hypothetical protein
MNSPRPHGTSVIAAHMAVKHPKVDAIPPSAIHDLKAELLSDGRVKLTWTAPGDDGDKGRAAWYQVKYHTGRLVERVEGWPDRSDPLPVDKKAWEARAAAFNAKQRSFWASRNVDGETPPGPAGEKQWMLIDIGDHKRLDVAIKTWDDADNVSAISNVVTVEVK